MREQLVEAGFAPPVYEGSTIANVPATVAALLQKPFQGLPPLNKPAWEPLQDGVKRVIVFLVDAMGQNLWDPVPPALQPLWERALVRAQLTSVFPSTTVAALSSLWTGVAPAQHGFVGFRMFLPELAVLGQMLQFTPNYRRHPDALTEAGLLPENFLEVPGVAQQLSTGDVPTYSFKGYNILGSSLSRMHERGVTRSFPIVTAADMFAQMRDLLEAKAGQPMYIFAYWPAIDTLSHMHGPHHPSVGAEMRSVFALLQKELWGPLSAAGRSGTALFVTADHGQVETPPEKTIYLSDHPDLERLLLMRPAGEARTLYLYARQGQQQAIVDYIESHLGHAMKPMLAGMALEHGLLGPQPHAPETELRVGDVIVTMRDGYILLAPDETESVEHMKGRHAGMTPGEMQVPWLGFRLDE